MKGVNGQTPKSSPWKRATLEFRKGRECIPCILSENNYCPNKLYFFKNIQNLQFNNIEISNSIHTITPNNNIINDIMYPLPLFKFKSTDILYIYINDNLGEETTRINYLDFNGKINKFANKTKIVNCVYELKPNKKGFKFTNNSVVL